MPKVAQKSTRKSSTIIKNTQRVQIIQRYAQSPRHKQRITIVAKVEKLISACYVLSSNKRMTPLETVHEVKNLFGATIEVDQVYRYRYKQRKAFRMTPHDKTAKFFPKGYTKVKKEI